MMIRCRARVHRASIVALFAFGGLAFGSPASAVDAFPDTVLGNGFEPCTGVQCFQLQCAGGQTTSVSGTVTTPNGLLPLPNVEVYVPSTGLDAIADGPAYDRCGIAPSGHPIAAALSDTNGNFTIRNMPATTNVPLVLVAGKWRRQVTIGNVPQCTNTPVAADDSRLPANHSEGHIPHIAIATGDADSVECLMRKTGVVDTEFSSSAGSGRIHLFVGNGVNKIDGGATLADATTLWASSASLSAYDQVMAGCEGSQNPATKPATAISALKTFADAGGRVYLSHWHNIWIAGESGNPSHAGAWPAIATWDFSGAFPTSPLIGQVDNSFPQGANFYAWLTTVGASAIAGTLSIAVARQTAITVDSNLARRWIYLGTTSLNEPSVQYFSFTTPTDEAASAQKGRVLFTDMRAAVGDTSPTNGSFPSTGCVTATTATTPQEKALIYATFDLQRCVGTTKE